MKFDYIKESTPKIHIYTCSPTTVVIRVVRIDDSEDTTTESIYLPLASIEDVMEGLEQVQAAMASK